MLGQSPLCFTVDREWLHPRSLHTWALSSSQVYLGCCSLSWPAPDITCALPPVHRQGRAGKCQWGFKLRLRNEEREPVCITRCTISPPFLLQSYFKDAFFPSSVFPRPDFCMLGGQCRIEEEGEHLFFTLYLGNQQVYNRKIKYLSITFTQYYQSPF